LIFEKSKNLHLPNFPIIINCLLWLD
jgi:hypothetical protein